jgi:hypothetical protein
MTRTRLPCTTPPSLAINRFSHKQKSANMLESCPTSCPIPLFLSVNETAFVRPVVMRQVVIVLDQVDTTVVMQSCPRPSPSRLYSVLRRQASASSWRPSIATAQTRLHVCSLDTTIKRCAPTLGQCTGSRRLRPHKGTPRAPGVKSNELNYTPQPSPLGLGRELLCRKCGIGVVSGVGRPGLPFESQPLHVPRFISQSSPP